ncbi:MAG TPA: phenylalanine--tRNA ligase subunit alpha [Flavobacteriales bacterium]|jgi:phenylalanyl-tRNA synthetase alpha chain|nr:phenylalanine--tRNA ligase subunit alpha [Flavobacteriales bacterium]
MSLTERITALEAELKAAAASTADEVERFRVAMLGRNGQVTALFDEFKTLAAEEKRAVGQRLNQLKNAAQSRWEELKAGAQTSVTEDRPRTDPTRPALAEGTGSLHPITIVRQRIVDVFGRIGYTVSQGPEVEDDHHNFSALNFPPDHPARDMQDTFFVRGAVSPSGAEGLALRTHTSSVQVRVMESTKPPIRTISPGRVYRNEAISARAHCMFHQVEGLYVDKGVSFAELKGTLDYFAKTMFGADVVIRMRPSYFPFTEPSAEVDMSCTICGGAGCNVCKHSGWVEIMGCGMVDPAVLSNCGIDPNVYSGFAFGMGVERVAQLIYRVPDLRLYWENDVRFLEQFTDGAFRA